MIKGSDYRTYVPNAVIIHPELLLDTSKPTPQGFIDRMTDKHTAMVSNQNPDY